MPSYTDRTIVKNREAGTYQSFGCADPQGIAAELHTTRPFIDKAADDGAAATATTETRTGLVVFQKSRLKSVQYYATTGGITGDNTNNATITISKRDAADGTKTTLATFTTNVAAGNVVQGVLKAFSLTATTANLVIDAGSAISFEISKAGTGVVVRAGRIFLELEAI